jgi:hypothetical protein
VTCDLNHYDQADEQQQLNRVQQNELIDRYDHPYHRQQDHHLPIEPFQFLTKTEDLP